MEDTETNKEYIAASVLPILKMSDGKEYIVLVKRTEDVKTSPDCHAGFAGWANKEEFKKPKLAAQREALEEILIFFSDRKEVYNLIFEENNVFGNEETVKLIKLWNKKLKKEEKQLNIPEDSIKPAKVSVLRELEYIPDGIGTCKAFILECDFSQSNIDNLHFFDGERNEELPDDDEKNLLDREISLFELSKFKNWWLSDGAKNLEADISFKTGEKVSDISINKDKMSSSLSMILNKWLKSQSKV